MTTYTLLPIYTFAKVIGLNPLHIMQVDAPIGSAESRVSIEPIFQYSWQNADGVSREELAQGIADAEQEIADYLGYWPAPTWQANERVELTERAGSWFRSPYDIRGDSISCKARYGELISGGRLAKTLIAAGQPVTYTDTDLDTYFETATVTVATSVTDPEEIAVYYPGLSGDDEWEIRPIKVSITGGVATITCRRELLVIKDLLESLNALTVNGMVDSNFLTTVDVYRKYNDPSVQVQLVWRNSNIAAWGCLSCAWSTSGCPGCQLNIQTGCMTVKDKKLGIVTMTRADWDAATSSYTPQFCNLLGRADYVNLWYRSGYRDMSLSTPNLTLSREWAKAISILALSKIDRLIKSPRGVSDAQAHWNVDLRRNEGTPAKSQSIKVTPYELEACPFGTTVAGITVWRLAKRRTLGLDSV